MLFGLKQFKLSSISLHQGTGRNPVSRDVPSPVENHELIPLTQISLCGHPRVSKCNWRLLKVIQKICQCNCLTLLTAPSWPGMGCLLSDHLAITFLVNIPIKAPCKFRQVNTRKIHKINITDFREVILNSDLIKHPHTTASLLSHQYFNTLCNILDKHAPIKRKVAPLHRDKGFVNSDILAAKCLKWKCERVWRSDISEINWSRYRAAVNHWNSQDAGTILQLLLKIMVTPRHCATLSQKS